MNRVARGLACTALIALAVPTSSHATDWTGANSTNWFDAGNWSAGVPTGATDAIVATITPNPTVVAGGTAIAQRLRVGFVGGPGQVTVTGPGASLFSGLNNTVVGETGTGTLSVLSGGALGGAASVGVIGLDAGSNGTATISGAGSRWDTAGLVVGNLGTGALNVASGGVVRHLALGASIGGFASGVGSATVTGAGSRWTIGGGVNVGDSGRGTLAILNGGVVTNASAIIGNNAGSRGAVTVDGAGSVWESSGQLFIGRSGAGTLTIQNGGTVTASSVLMIADGVAGFDAAATLNIGAASGAAAAAPGTLSAPSIVVGSGLGLSKIVFNHTSTNYTFAPVVTGSLSGFSRVDVLAGTTILTGVGSSIRTDVNGGTLLVNGSSTGPTTVFGGTLGGSGVVGDTDILGSGTLSPGSSIGTLTVQGNLSFSTAATYLVEISPSDSDRSIVTGKATLGGARVSAVYASGSYVSRRYTILSAAGGVVGTFSSLVNTNLPANFTPSLAYDGNNAYLDLTMILAQPTASGGSFNGNQTNVASALINSFNAAGGIPLAFGALTPQGLTQISGEAATGAQQTTFGVMDSFVNVMSDPFSRERGNSGTPTAATGYADENALAYAAKRKGRSLAEQDAYAAMVRKAPPRVPFERRWSVWGAGYGGAQTTEGNAAAGSADVTSRIYGGATGLDYRIDPDTLVGFSLGGAGTRYNLAGGLGGGSSDVFQAGIYGRHDFSPAYVAGALAYGWQDVTTDRVALLNSYRGRFDVNAFTGRLEGGYRYAMGVSGLTPYAAGQFTTLLLPAYAEQTIAGVNTFALAYSDRDVTASRSELGLRADTSFAVQDAVVTLRGRAAWAHNFDTDRGIAAVFQALPASAFVVNGAAQARDSALVTAGAEAKWLNGFSVAAAFEGEFSNVTESYAGKGMLRYQW